MVDLLTPPKKADKVENEDDATLKQVGAMRRVFDRPSEISDARKRIQARMERAMRELEEISKPAATEPVAKPADYKKKTVNKKALAGVKLSKLAAKSKPKKKNTQHQKMEVDAEEQSAEDAETKNCQRKKKRRRTCRRKILTEQDKRLKVVKAHLAVRGVTWAKSQWYHNRRPSSADDRNCKKKGGFLALQHKLASTTEQVAMPNLVECHTRLALLEDCGFCLGDLLTEMDEFFQKDWASPLKKMKAELGISRKVPLPIPPDTGLLAICDGSMENSDSNPTPAAPDAKTKKEEPKFYNIETIQSLLEPMQCLQFLPVGQFGKRVPIRCLACRSLQQPDGKVFEGGSFRMDDLDSFVDQHCRGATHVASFVKWQKEKQNAADGPDSMPIMNPGDEQKKVACAGISLTHGDQAISDYREEFKIWASHTNLSSTLSKHEYIFNVRTEELTIFHQSCLKVVSVTKQNARPVCQSCLESGKSTALNAVKNTIRFNKKYWIARLLHAKLFHSPEKAKEVEDMVKSTMMFKLHPDSVQKLLDMNNSDMQGWLRKRMAFVSKDPWSCMKYMCVHAC